MKKFAALVSIPYIGNGKITMSIAKLIRNLVLVSIPYIGNGKLLLIALSAITTAFAASNVSIPYIGNGKEKLYNELLSVNQDACINPLYREW